MDIKQQLEEFWYNYITNFTNYPCLLSGQESEEYSFPRLKFEIIEVGTTDLSVTSTNIYDDGLKRNYSFQAKYKLEINAYYVDNIDLDDLIFNLSNIYSFTDYTRKIDFSKYKFKDISLRDSLNAVDVSKYLQDQATKRIRYQRNFVIRYETNKEIPSAKIIETKEEKWQEK